MRASLYEALGIPPTASDEEVRAALRRLIRKYYAKTRDGQGNVEEALRFINHASRILSDPDRRVRYNGELARSGDSVPAKIQQAVLSALVATNEGTVRLETPLVGRGNLANVLAGLAVGLDAGVPLDAMAARAATLAPPAHRGEVRALASGVTVIDDAYNANPLAVERALDVLGETAAPRRVAVLGEMLELGPESAALHARVGRAAAKAGVALLVTVGGDPARALGRGAVDAGLPAAAIRHAGTSDEAAAVVEALVRPGDVVLVKGSRGVRLERVVDRLAGGLR